MRQLPTLYNQPNAINRILENNSEYEINVLLHYIVFGNPKGAGELLEKNPLLLTQKGDVILPSGDTVVQQKPYKLALLLGDHYPDMLNIFEEHFKKINNGEQEQQTQYNECKRHLEDMLDQKPYDFSSLLDIIEKSPDSDVQIALEKKFETDTPLNDALKKFRDDFKRRTITKDGMLFNYNSLLRILSLFCM